MVKGKDAPSVLCWPCEAIGKTAGHLLLMLMLYFGTGRYIVLDSGFYFLRAIIELKRNGLCRHSSILPPLSFLPHRHRAVIALDTVDCYVPSLIALSSPPQPLSYLLPSDHHHHCIIVIAVGIMLLTPTANTTNANANAKTTADINESFVMPNLACRQRGEGAPTVGMVGKVIEKRLADVRCLPAMASGGGGRRV